MRYGHKHGHEAAEAIEWEHVRLERLIATTPARTVDGAYAQMLLMGRY